jgi:hypothetical protein
MDESYAHGKILLKNAHLNIGGYLFSMKVISSATL